VAKETVLVECGVVRAEAEERIEHEAYNAPKHNQMATLQQMIINAWLAQRMKKYSAKDAIH